MANFNRTWLKISLRTAAVACFGFAATSALACDRTQQIKLTVGNKLVEQWSGTTDKIRTVALPNNFKLGVKIEETSREKYEELMRRMRGKSVPELVKISLYDMTTSEPRKITSTWGGANSQQGYGSKGGADRVDEVGSPGILFTLSKPTCTDAKALELTREMIVGVPLADTLNQKDEKSQPSADNLRGKAAALADAKAGNYRLVYPDVLSPEEITVMRRVFAEEGLQLATESEAFATTSPGFSKGYMAGMMEAVLEKLGAPKMKEIEARIKAGMATLELAKK
jgi:hypothetical protein